MRKSTLNQFSFRRSNILFTLTTPFSNAVWSIWIIIWWFFNWWFWTWIIIRFAKNTSISRTISLIQYRSHHITHCRVHNIAHTISHNIVQTISLTQCHTISLTQYRSYNIAHTISHNIAHTISHNIAHTISLIPYHTISFKQYRSHNVTQYRVHNTAHTISHIPYHTISFKHLRSYHIAHTISLIPYRSHNIAHTISHNSLDIAPCLNTRDFHWIVYFGILFASSNWYYNLRRRFSFVFYCTIHWCNSCIVCFYWLHAIVLRFVTVRTKYITFTIVFKQYGVSKKKGLRISKDREMTDCGFNIDFNMLFILFQDV